ncbi:hypothetical protein VCRA2110O2_30305 [Vibrio crassostreae]|nr:hypothetical protein VCHA44O286_50071 [Vibrio chagasii]CAK2871752.1 hypothetical protein VCRA2110O2_30305 [Vibrio crassostreae]
MQNKSVRRDLAPMGFDEFNELATLVNHLTEAQLHGHNKHNRHASNLPTLKPSSPHLRDWR